MIVSSFTSPSYGKKTLNQVQRCVNLYPEKTDDGLVLVSAPGLALLASTSFNGQALGVYYSSSGKLFLAHDQGIAEIAAAGTGTDRGTFVLSGFADMVDNGVKLLLAAGGTGYVLNMASGSAAAIVDANYPANCQSVAYLDGYFLAAKPGTSLFYVSAVDDPTDWTPITGDSADTMGDTITRIYAHNGQLVIFGAQSIEVWINTGNSSFPFERITGSPLQIGMVGWTLDKCNGSLYFLSSNDAGGAGAVWKLDGLTPTRITPPYLESLFSGYSSPSGAIGYCYHFDGHDFYELTFPSNNISWVYDIQLNAWHERDSFVTPSYLFHRPFRIINAFWTTGQTPYAIDYSGGRVYALSLTTNTENGADMRRIRDFGPIKSPTLKKVFHSRIRIELEIDHDSSATYTLSAVLTWSDDGGKSYNAGVTMTQAVTSGTTGQRVVLTANRLGSSAERYYRVTFTGPAARFILKTCDLDAKEGRF